ncbi:MAG: hypothetical protein BAJALOKI2v1_730009 [Promethearchaeota archaeon]|nr:MAG: hypothetical protein BAJALOKI2v1_730009 [Candidatus Lokiarchaeota archaeon]
MSIDWIKAEEKPKKTQKVKGKDLMKLRRKINELEKELQNKLDTLEKISNEMTEFNLELNDKKRILNLMERTLNRKGILTKEQYDELIEKAGMKSIRK